MQKRNRSSTKLYPDPHQGLGGLRFAMTVPPDASRRRKDLVMVDAIVCCETMVMILVGAGTSKSTFNVPMMIELQRNFSNTLEADEDRPVRELYQGLERSLRTSYGEWGVQEEVDIEAVLTALEDMSELRSFRKRWRHPSILSTLDSLSQIRILDDFTNSLDCELASTVARRLKQYVVRRCDITGKPATHDIYTEFFEVILAGGGLHFKEIVGDQNSNATFSVFTTNYDLCLEEYFRTSRHPFQNGETRTVSGESVVDLTKGHTSLYGGSTAGAKIFKLHGSINWYRVNKRSEIFWTDQPATVASRVDTRYGALEREVVIFPISGKRAAREPFSDAFWHFRNELLTNEDWFIAGYSFRDREIRDLFLDSFRRRKEKGRKTNVFLLDPMASEIAKDKLDEVEVISVDRGFDLEGLKCLDERIQSETS